MRLWAGLLLGLSLAQTAWAGQPTWGDHAKLYAVPRRAPGLVDGGLDEWDRSGQISLEASADQGANLAAMYDDEALYLAGEVRDTSPLAGQGDGCTLWLNPRPELGYPLPAGTERGCIRVRLHAAAGGAADRAALLTISGPPLHPAGYDGAWRLLDRGLGYRFEYRLPWATLGFARPPEPGELTAAAVRFDWEPAANQAIDWAGDLLTRPGLSPDERPGSWGRLIFARAGRLPPQLAGDSLRPDPPRPLVFRGGLPADAYVTLQIQGEDGWFRRLAVAGERRRAGAWNEPWDGCDDQGRALPAGRYRWLGLYHFGLGTRAAETGTQPEPGPESARFSRDSFGRWDNAGRLLWGFGELRLWPECPARAGWLAQLTEARGGVTGLVAAGDEADPTRLFTDDGLYLASFASGGRLAASADGQHRYLVGPSTVEITGLEAVRRLPGGVLTLGGDDAQLAREASAAYQAALARPRAASLARGTAREWSIPISRWLDRDHGFTARLGCDERLLHLALEVTGAAEALVLLTERHRVRIAPQPDGAGQVEVDGQPAGARIEMRREPGPRGLRWTLALPLALLELQPRASVIWPFDVGLVFADAAAGLPPTLALWADSDGAGSAWGRPAGWATAE